MKIAMLVLSLAAFVVWGTFEIYFMAKALKSQSVQAETIDLKVKLWYFILYAMAQLAIIMVNYLS